MPHQCEKSCTRFCQNPGNKTIFWINIKSPSKPILKYFYWPSTITTFQSHKYNIHLPVITHIHTHTISVEAPNQGVHQIVEVSNRESNRRARICPVGAEPPRRLGSEALPHWWRGHFGPMPRRRCEAFRGWKALKGMAVSKKHGDSPLLREGMKMLPAKIAADSPRMRTVSE